MRQLERRQIVLFAILGIVLVALLMWKFVLSGGGDSSTAVQPTTVTSVVNGQAQSDPADPNATTGTGTTGTDATTPTTTAFVDEPFVVGAYRDPFAPAG